MNIPNALTIFRIFLTFIFIYLYSREGLDARVLALAIFTVASITDFLDGYIARKANLITQFGKIMDPIADKFLTLSAFFIFMDMKLMAEWAFILILARELIVTGLRFFAMGKGIALAAEKAGKLKTVLQIGSIYFIMIFTILSLTNTESQSHQEFLSGYLKNIDIAVWSVVLITLWSGISFMWNNRKEIFNVR